jgi:6-pyruvoyl-tetrahydropterin synthase
MDKGKDCSSCRNGTDIINVPSADVIEKFETSAKKYEETAVGIFRAINEQPLAQVKDILRDDFIIHLINYLDNPKKIVKARMTIHKSNKTTYHEYKIEGLLTVDKFDNAPVVFNLSKEFGYVIKSIDFSYINKDGKQMTVSKAARFVINRIVCKRLLTTLRKIQIDYLTKNSKMLNNNESSSYYNANFKEVLGRSIGDIIDKVTKTLDPINSTKGLKKFIKNLNFRYFVPISPSAFDNNNNDNKTRNLSLEGSDRQSNNQHRTSADNNWHVSCNKCVVDLNNFCATVGY